MQRLLIVALAAMSLWSCSLSNIKRDYDLASAVDSGVVAGSITYEGVYGEYILHVIGADGKSYRISHGQSQTLNIMKAFGGEDANALLGRRGSPFAVELPAGDYRVDSWQISSGPANVWSQQPANVTFRVLAKQAIYLGNFDFAVTEAFVRNPTKAVVTLKDERTRDLLAVRSTFPALANVPVTAALSPGTVLQRVGGDSRGKMQLYLPISR